MNNADIRAFLEECSVIWINKLKLNEEPDDIAQEVWLKLWEAKRLPCEEALMAVAVKNHCLDVKKAPINDTVELEECYLNDKEDKSLEVIDRQRWLNQTLKQYSWTEQKAIRLRLQGLDLAAIGRETGLGKSRVSVILSEMTDKLSTDWKS